MRIFCILQEAEFSIELSTRYSVPPGTGSDGWTRASEQIVHLCGFDQFFEELAHGIGSLLLPNGVGNLTGGFLKADGLGRSTFADGCDVEAEP